MNKIPVNSPWARRFYLITVFFLVLTGFGQMPVFKRYYIADIPGLGWLGKFYITHYMHYLFGILLLALVAYYLASYIIDGNNRPGLGSWGWIRVLYVGGLVVSGVLLVIRNMAGVYWSPGFIIGLDLTHMGLVMVLLFTGGAALIFKKK